MGISAPGILLQDHLSVSDGSITALVKNADIVRTHSRLKGTSKVVPLGLGRRGLAADQTTVTVMTV